jgi:hypothetical protein
MKPTNGYKVVAVPLAEETCRHSVEVIVFFCTWLSCKHDSSSPFVTLFSDVEGCVACHRQQHSLCLYEWA